MMYASHVKFVEHVDIVRVPAIIIDCRPSGCRDILALRTEKRLVDKLNVALKRVTAARHV